MKVMLQGKALGKFPMGNKQHPVLIQSFVDLNKNLAPYSRGECSLTICPVCGCLTYDDYFVCKVCGWEHDGTLLEREKSFANGGMCIGKYRKSFLNKCSNQIVVEYKKLKKKVKNKCRLFDAEFITYNPNTYKDFYSSSFVDEKTKEYIKDFFE